MVPIPVLIRSEAARLRAAALLRKTRERSDHALDLVTHARYLRSIARRHRNLLRHGLAPLA